jgi:hypothetical protein
MDIGNIKSQIDGKNHSNAVFESRFALLRTNIPISNSPVPKRPMLAGSGIVIPSAGVPPATITPLVHDSSVWKKVWAVVLLAGHSPLLQVPLLV